MAGFRKAKSEQAALKVAMFGPPGSGKTFTSLLLGEGIAAVEKKKVAFVDTEHGTDFYAMRVPGRRVHPEAFEFDALYTRALTEVVAACKALDPAEYAVCIIDSMTHLWEAAVNAYTGPKHNGKIPMHAWGKIKAPYKALMQWMINTPLHVFILGRQANEWGQDDDTGETISAGVKMKAEGETAYEPHILLRMEGVKPLRDDRKTVKKNAEAVPTMFVVKDRTGVLQGRVIENPDFETVAAPLLGLLGKTQAQIAGEEETTAKDAEALRLAEVDKDKRSAELRRDYIARFQLATGKKEEIAAIAKELTPERKKDFRPRDLEDVRAAWQEASEGRSPSRAEPASDAAE